MAVAEKPVTEKAASSPEAQLAKSSLLGGLFVLISLWVVFGGIPELWNRLFHPLVADKVENLLNPFLSSALLLLAEIVVIVGLVFLGRVLETPNPVHGLRAGIFILCIFFFIIVWITNWIGSLMADPDLGLGGVGVFLTVGVFAALVFFVSRFFRKPGFARWLCRTEDNGWFHATSYKPNQGMRVRRGSMLALMFLGGCGIITSINHVTWGSDRLGPNNWQIVLPFSDYVEYVGNTATEFHRYLPMMFKIHYTMPFVLALLLVWVSWRVVNWPVFTDFLIATEAEMNKVSWTSRKRLIQDTVVVLVTVALLTTFLFVVDIIWIKVLSWDWIQVLRVDPGAELRKQQEKTQW